MCEFCLEHGEGKIWYKEMKHYSDILLHEPITPEQQAWAGTETRSDWVEDFFKSYVVQTFPGYQTPESEDQEGDETPPTDQPEPSLDEIIARRKAVHFGQVLPLEDVEEVIDMVDSITRIPCGCRFYRHGLSDQRYCFGFGVDTSGILGKYPEASSSLEVLEKEEAKTIFRAFDNEGLIHSVWTGLTPYVIGLCNCDRDCFPYRRQIEEGGSQGFFRAEYICEVDWDLCDGCKECFSQCQFGAQFYSSSLEKVYISPEHCYGCGVCRTACPNNAIDLIPRREVQAAADLW
jgi:NAD-dependent dihydropyrimidine dehydrogenase PreA subunit